MVARRQTKAPPLALPATALSRDGVEFKPHSDVWNLGGLSNATPLKFSEFATTCPRLAGALKASLLWLATHRSGPYVRNTHREFLNFIRHEHGRTGRCIDQIAVSALLAFRAAGPRNATRLGKLRPFLLRWHELGYPGLDHDAYLWLERVRLPGNAKGVAVATLDPRQGPLSDLELESFLDALTAGLASEAIALDDCLAVLLTVLLAPRPVQLVAMKIEDVVVQTARDGTTSYFLKVPRAKQRNQRPRTEAKLRPIPPQVGELLQIHAIQVREAFRGKLDDPTHAPLFPSRWAEDCCIPDLAFHQQSNALSARIRNSLISIMPLSERTGRPLHVTALRLRRTFGTRLRAEGHSLKVIAELLDHSDLQSVRVYSAVRPMILKRISKKLSFSLAPLVRAFKGAPIETLTAGARRITDFRVDSSGRRPVGCCGTFRTCDFAAPIACYTCADFRPWVDGPHESMLARLLQEHRRILETCDERIASTLFRSILAVAEVVQLCRKSRSSRGTDE